MRNWLREQRYLWLGGPMPQVEMVRVDTRMVTPEVEAILESRHALFCDCAECLRKYGPHWMIGYLKKLREEQNPRDRFFALLNMEQGHE